MLLAESWHFGDHCLSGFVPSSEFRLRGTNKSSFCLDMRGLGPNNQRVGGTYPILLRLGKMNRCRIPISCLAVLSILAGNFAATRQGCCHGGPFAAECRCHAKVEASSCPHCTQRRGCCAKQQTAAARPNQTTQDHCRCAQHAPTLAVVDSSTRTQLSVQALMSYRETNSRLIVRARFANSVGLREPLHPPRHSLSARHCSWQV